MKTKIQLAYFLVIFIAIQTACGTGAIPSQSTSHVSATATIKTLVTATDPTVIQLTAVPTMETKSQLPACNFPLDQTTKEESKEDQYTFSNPKLVFTDNLQPDIVDWLPDSENVIIMPTKLIDVGLGFKGYQQTIELFNPMTQKTQIYAIRWERGGKPAWNPEFKAMVYPATKMVGTDKKSVKFFSQLRMSYGDPDKTQLLIDDLPDNSITVKSDGSQIVYHKSNEKHVNQFFSRMVSNNSLQAEELIPVDLMQLIPSEDYPIIYSTIWRLDTSQIFFYSYVSPTDQTILLDVNTGKSCTISFDGWVYFARWSPNRRYLAVIKSPSPRLSLWADFNLSVLDALTGKLYQIDSTKVGPLEMKNCCRHIMGDFSWAPDNHHLVVEGSADFVGTGTHNPIRKLYLVDFHSGNVDEIFPSYQFNIGWWGTGLAWSPDGLKLLVNCPTEEQGRLCLINVERTAQP